MRGYYKPSRILHPAGHSAPLRRNQVRAKFPGVVSRVHVDLHHVPRCLTPTTTRSLMPRLALVRHLGFVTCLLASCVAPNNYSVDGSASAPPSTPGAANTPDAASPNPDTAPPAPEPDAAPSPDRPAPDAGAPKLDAPPAPDASP